MKTIKILGTGCPKCKQMFNIVEEVVNENNIEAKITKIEDIMEIMEYNVLTTPVLLVNEEIKHKGSVPSKMEILQYLK